MQPTDISQGHQESLSVSYAGKIESAYADE